MINSLKTKLQKQSLIGFTGSLGAGKDYVADALGASKASMAEPLYAMTKLFFNRGSVDRSEGLPVGLRECWQTFGQWGKGTVSQEYPLTPVRAMFETFVRDRMWPELLQQFGETFGVRWEDYGRDENLWIKAMVHRLKGRRLSPDRSRTLTAVTNIRFKCEVDAFKAQGWPLIHVLASPATLRARQDAQHTSEEARSNSSERLAHQINDACYHVCYRSTPTPDLPDWLADNGFGWVDAVVWNDTEGDPSINEFLTIGQLKAIVEEL